MPLYFHRALGFAAAMAWFGAFSAEDWGSRWPYALVSTSALIFLSLKKAIALKLGLTLLLIGILFFIYALCSRPEPTPNDLCKFNGFNGLIRVRIIDDPKPFGIRSFSCTVNPLQMIFPQERKLDGNAQLVFSISEACKVERGDFLEVRAALRAPEDPVEPWKFQTKRYLNRRAIFCIATTRGALTKMQAPTQSFLDTIINDVVLIVAAKRRAIFQAHLANIGATYAPLLQSIVLGDKMTDLPKEVKNDFRHVGLSHITAASGFNLTVVVGIAYWFTALFCKTGILKRVIPIAAILLFVLMAGPSPSVVRAALCCSTFLLSSHFRRKFSPLAVFSLSLLVSLSFDPLLATDVGAELSYGATFGIICLAQNITALRQEDGTRKLAFGPGAIRVWFLESLAILSGVQVTVLPIQLVYFWQTGLAFLPANLIVEPVVAPLTVAGFISSFLAALAAGPWAPPFKCVAYWIDQFACFLLKFILCIVDRLSHFPDAVINVGPPSAAQVFTYYLLVIFLLVSLTKRKLLLLAGATYLMALTLLLYRPPLRAPVICVSHEFLAVVDVDHKGYCLGEAEQSEKFLAYYGANARLMNVAYRPERILSLPDGFKITISRNHRILHDQRFEGDRNHPFTLFCGRGMTAAFD